MTDDPKERNVSCTTFSSFSSCYTLVKPALGRSLLLSITFRTHNFPYTSSSYCLRFVLSLVFCCVNCSRTDMTQDLGSMQLSFSLLSFFLLPTSLSSFLCPIPLLSLMVFPSFYSLEKMCTCPKNFVTGKEGGNRKRRIVRIVSTYNVGVHVIHLSLPFIWFKYTFCAPFQIECIYPSFGVLFSRHRTHSL